MFAVSVNASSSSAEAKLPVTWTVAPERLAESGSVTVSVGSIAFGPSPSVYGSEPLVVVSVGASFTGVIVTPLLAGDESASPSFTVNSIERDAVGASLVVRNVTDR